MCVGSVVWVLCDCCMVSTVLYYCWSLFVCVGVRVCVRVRVCVVFMFLFCLMVGEDGGHVFFVIS